MGDGGGVGSEGRGGVDRGEQRGSEGRESIGRPRGQSCNVAAS
jgi:hypothetical protein